MLKRALIAMTLIATTIGCGESVQRTAVYEELRSAEDPSLTHAMRMTVFQFDGRVGGHIEYFAREDAVGSDVYLNDPEACVYFGAAVVRDDVFALRTVGPDGESQLLAVAERRGDDLISLTFERSTSLGGMWIPEASSGALPAPVDLARRPSAGIAERCP